MPRYRYLLGDARTERARLRHQASIWDPTALALFDRLKLRRTSGGIPTKNYPYPS